MDETLINLTNGYIHNANVIVEEIVGDLFASSILHKTEFFYSKAPMLGSWGANAINFKWNRESYCHPPKYLVYEVSKKIEA